MLTNRKDAMIKYSWLKDKDIKEPVKKFDEEQSEDDKLRERLEEIIDDFFEDTNQRGETASALKIDQEFDLTNDLSLINLEDNATDLTVELEKMIQSAGPFQTARPGQSYGHATANGYRQPASYHHQVSDVYLFSVSFSLRIKHLNSMMTEWWYKKKWWKILKFNVIQFDQTLENF